MCNSKSILALQLIHDISQIAVRLCGLSCCYILKSKYLTNHSFKYL